MKNKVVLFLVDAMTPAGMEKCGNNYVSRLKKESSYTMSARTVKPSITLPCHISLFSGVSPCVHKTMNNTFTPNSELSRGLFEQLSRAGKKTAFFYNWEELRDITPPGFLNYSLCIKQAKDVDTDRQVADAAIKYILEESPDFAFVYLGIADDVGHHFGWESSAYYNAVNNSVSLIEKVIASLPNCYNYIVTADHGGHGFIHDAGIEEDMQIPLFLQGDSFEAGKTIENASILDIAPTIAELLGVEGVTDWEGSSLV